MIWVSEQTAIRKVTPKDLWAVMWRNHFFQSGFNFERFMGIGQCMAMIPVIKRLYDTPEQISAALKRQLTFCVTHPWMSSLIQGIAAAQEEDYANGGPTTEEDIIATKTALMGPLAGFGDPLFWFTIRPILQGIGITYALQGSIFGPIFFFVVWNIVHYVATIYLTFAGYRAGVSLLVRSKETIQNIKLGATVMGLFILGGMLPMFTKLSTPLTLTVQNQTIKLQEALDSILPHLLPMSLGFLLVYLLRRGWSSITLLFAVAIVGILGHVLRIFS